MLFNSPEFMLFFSAVFIAYYLLPFRFRWAFMLAASYFFYMSWKPEYALLLVASTLIIYSSALLMEGRSVRTRRILLAASFFINLGFLFFFKYFNFFSRNLKDLFGIINIQYNVPELNLLMPVGISFYILQALSYTMDVYRGTRKAERHIGILALYVSFFPVILSGPIERSTNLLPQLREEKSFDYDRVTDGLKLVAWGLFQKLVIADRLAIYVNKLFSSPASYEGFAVLIGIYFFSIQIYCDFCGYSDIAIGIGQMMGYKLVPNFKRPFLSTSISDLWRRWHMSLLSWFRDYLYIPLGGSRVSSPRFFINTMLVCVISGLWHGAQWTFILWGALNGAFIFIGRITGNFRQRSRDLIFDLIGRVPMRAYFVSGISLSCFSLLAIFKLAPDMFRPAMWAVFAAGLFLIMLGAIASGKTAKSSPADVLKRVWMTFVTFNLFTFSVVFFRAASVKDGVIILSNLLTLRQSDIFMGLDKAEFISMLGLVSFLFGVNIMQNRGSIRDMIRRKPLWMRWTAYHLLALGILLGIYKTSMFIYFQF